MPCNEKANITSNNFRYLQEHPNYIIGIFFCKIAIIKFSHSASFALVMTVMSQIMALKVNCDISIELCTK